MKKYYSLETEGTKADLYIFGDITSYPWLEKDKDSYGIVKELQNLDVDEVDVHINSYGGEVAEGLAIYNVLKNSKYKVTTYCDGFACSAASVIFMAGHERIMNSASLLMIHNAWSYAAGNADDFRKQAEDLDKITQASVNAYMSKVSITEDELKAKMDGETWLTAEESLTDGFATKILEQEDTGVNQSAFSIIREKVLNCGSRIAPVQTLETGVLIDTEEIAKKVVEKLRPIMETLQSGTFITGEGQQMKESGTGWGVFFNEEKEIEK